MPHADARNGLPPTPTASGPATPKAATRCERRQPHAVKENDKYHPRG